MASDSPRMRPQTEMNHPKPEQTYVRIAAVIRSIDAAFEEHGKQLKAVLSGVGLVQATEIERELEDLAYLRGDIEARLLAINKVTAQELGLKVRASIAQAGSLSDSIQSAESGTTGEEVQNDEIDPAHTGADCDSRQ